MIQWAACEVRQAIQAGLLGTTMGETRTLGAEGRLKGFRKEDPKSKKQKQGRSEDKAKQGQLLGFQQQ